MVHEVSTAKKPCRRCLLEAAGETDLAAAIAERVSLIPEEEKADAALYEKRLSVCAGCSSLNRGTCAECGCYVELRAAKVINHCPSERKKW